MDTHSFKLASLILATSLVGLASRADAEPRPPLNVVLHVCDDPGIHRNLVNRAKVEMGRIFRDVGIDIAWTDEVSTRTGPDDPQPPASSDPQLTLVMLCQELTDEVTVDPTALGGAVGTRDYRGHIAYVFYDRVERFARTLNMSRDPEADDLYSVIVLAHAMAHEVGHLLLPYGHSATGLMRAEWDAKDMRLAVERRLNFTPEQAELIRGQLFARIGDTRSPASN